jgi:hypothetical protein
MVVTGATELVVALICKTSQNNFSFGVAIVESNMGIFCYDSAICSVLWCKIVKWRETIESILCSYKYFDIFKLLLDYFGGFLTL